MQLGEAGPDLASAVLLDPSRSRDRLWEHARNSLGIARLLAQERRAEAFVATACHAAVENALRAAVAHAGRRFEGVAEALAALDAPADLGDPAEGPPGCGRLAASERIVAWVAVHLRSEAPERNWGY